MLPVNTVLHGDCREVMKELPDNSVDAIVTDPPYELGFMGKKWDSSGIAYNVEMWAEVLRVAKPGAHLLAFGGTRTHHRMICAIEDAGWEVRDCLGWLYGSGFPKSLDVSKAIDKAAGAEREVVGIITEGRASTPRQDIRAGRMHAQSDGDVRGYLGNKITAPATDAAKQWEGWGTALKPAVEYICLARKPLIGTVAENVLRHGTGGINVDGCRVGTESTIRNQNDGPQWSGKYNGGQRLNGSDSGRFPANIIHDGSDEVMALFPETTSNTRQPTGKPKYTGSENDSNAMRTSSTLDTTVRGHTDSGSAARFFYCAKASKKERGNGNSHPTIKPLKLMKYLCRLITPPGGLVLDPFAGSGTTAIAAQEEGFNYLLIEREQSNFDMIQTRLAQHHRQLPLLAMNGGIA